MSISGKELVEMIEYFESIKEHLDGLDWSRIEVLLGAIEGMHERGRSLPKEPEEEKEPVCCTLGCGKLAAPHRLHCVDHGRGDFAVVRGRKLPITVGELALGNALEDSGRCGS